MIRRGIDDIAEDDLRALVDNQVSEGRSLEFKRELPGGSDADIKEFLADVTSLSNAQGGDLVYGMEETDGVASHLNGLQLDDADAAILRLENILRDGVEPRLSGARVRWIPLAINGGTVVVRVPASLAAPHRIRFKNSGRFFNRNSRGKYEMDTHELRMAFTSSEQMPQKLRSLHEQAVSAAKGAGLPFRLNDEPSAVVSVIPLSFLRDPQDLPITPETIVVPPKAAGGLTYLHTLEGILFRTPPTDQNTVRAYALTHRSGRVDAAWTIGGMRQNNGQTMKIVWPSSFKGGVLDIAGATASRLRQFGVEGPWALFASVFGLKDYIVMQDRYFGSEAAWRDGATLPEVITDDLSEESLKPLFDALPLCFGIPTAEYVYPDN